MTKWEYCEVYELGYGMSSGVFVYEVDPTPGEPDAKEDMHPRRRIAALGQQGWELVAVIPSERVIRYLFKRPVGARTSGA